MVVSVLDWVLAELVRLFHAIPANEAQEIVEQVVTRVAPVVQDFDGFLKVLNPDLKVSDHCLVLLYQRGTEGATYAELDAWARPSMRPNLKRTLSRLVYERDFAYDDGTRYRITRLGQVEVEERQLFSPV